MRRTKINLEFGAQVKNFVAPAAGAVVVASNDRKYDYAAFEAGGSKLPALLARAFQLTQSQSENANSRHKTNQSINDGIVVFLRWCDEKKLAPAAFSSKLLIDYQSDLKTRFKAWSVYSRYTVLARCCAVLMEVGLIDRFPVPKNISIASAKAGSSAGTTIATATKGGSSGLSADDANEKALGALIDAAWAEAFDRLDLLDQGVAWRQEARAWRVAQGQKKGAPRYMEPGPNPSRDDCLRLMVQNMELAFGGFSTEHSMPQAFPGLADPNLKAVASDLLKIASKQGGKIRGPEAHAYFHPSKELAGCVLFLLAASQINVESAVALGVDCLVEDSNPDVMRLSWSKWRAGGEQASMPFPKGASRKSKTIPNLLARYKEASTELRKAAPKKLQGILLIYGQGGTGEKGIPCMADARITPWILVKDSLAARIAAASGVDPAVKEVALRVLPQLTLSLVRTTALNVAGKRLNRDVSALASMDGRRSESALTGHYLSNASTREAWDGQIRQAQSAMLDWASQAPIVLPADAKVVAGSLGVEMAVARDIVEDELNAGMGASMVDGRVVVIDTPINALRMIQWIEKLGEAESRLLRHYPERWREVYQPQRKLFTDALAMVSKKSKAEAMKMAKDIQLPFPEVI